MYHVTTRGNAGAPIFLDDRDRDLFIKRLGYAVSEFEWKCLAYCLMGNHFHLAIETPEPTIASGMHALNGWYAQRFNWRYDRSGHLFEGPYHAELIENEGHLLEVTRYVVRNPVRAKLCRLPQQWPWSSYRAAIGLDPGHFWLATDVLLELFGGSSNGCDEYHRFVEEGTDRWPFETGPGTRSLDTARTDISRDQVPGHGRLATRPG
jgi:putative transposase